MQNQQQDKAVDVSGSPELRRVAEEVRRTGKAVVLRDGETALAIIVPLGVDSVFPARGGIPQ